jgi:hypothetical protein
MSLCIFVGIGVGLTLVVEGNPLVCAFSFDCEGDGAVVTGNTSCDDVISSKCLDSIVS